MRDTWFKVMACAAFAFAAPAQAFEFRSISENAIAYDASSLQAKPKLILLRGTPVEQITSANRWIKVRDANGGMAWVEERLVSNRRTVIVTTSQAQIRQQPKEDAPLAFAAIKNVTLEVVENPANGWVRVRHAEGDTGYVTLRQVWGI